MLNWLKRIEMGTTTYHDAQVASLWLVAMWLLGLLMGAALALFILQKS